MPELKRKNTVTSVCSFDSVGPWHCNDEVASGCTTNVVTGSLKNCRQAPKQFDRYATLPSIAAESDTLSRGTRDSPRTPSSPSSSSRRRPSKVRFMMGLMAPMVGVSSKKLWSTVRAPPGFGPGTQKGRKRNARVAEEQADGDVESQPISPSVRRRQDSRATATNYTWMFVFPLPPLITAQEEHEFERGLSGTGRTAEEVLHKSFGGFMDPASIDLAMQMPLPYDDKKRSRQRERKRKHGLSERLLDAKHDHSSRARALQCAIELTLCFFHSLDASCKKYFSQRALSMGSETPASKGVNVLKFTSRCKTRLFVCVRLSCEVAELHADIHEYPVQISKKGLETLGIKLSDESTTPTFLAYRQSIRDLCQLHPDAYEKGTRSVLRQMDRIRILYDKITDSINVNELKRIGLVSHSFPLHHEPTLRSLRKHWGRFGLLFSLQQPLDEIRAYFGEEIAFHFLFLHELAWYSLALAPIGILCWFIQHRNSGVARIVFGMFMLLWYRVFTKRWQQREARAANEWGMDNEESSTIKKPENIRFCGQLMPSPENEAVWSEQVSPQSRFLGRMFSLLLTFIFLLVLFVALIVEHYLYFLWMQASSQAVQNVSSLCFGVYVGAQVKVVDTIWDAISVRVSDLEYWRDETNFEWSQRCKALIVKFITSVLSICLVAFVEPMFFSNVGTRDIRDQLSKQLCCILVTRFLLINDFIDGMAKPFIKLRYRQYVHRLEDHVVELSPAELQVDMPTYSGSDLTNDYMDVILPLAFTVMFGNVCPIAAPILFVIIQANVRTDAWRLVTVYRRPYPRMLKDIGVMNMMLNFLAHAMIATNLGVVLVDFGGFTQFLPLMASTFEEMKSHSNLRIIVEGFCFITLWLLLTTLWHLVDALVPPLSAHTLLERRRQELQRHLLSYSGFEGINIRMVSISAKRMGDGRRDFRTVPPITEADSSYRNSEIFTPLDARRLAADIAEEAFR